MIEVAARYRILGPLEAEVDRFRTCRAAGRDSRQLFEIFWRSTPGTHEVLDQVAEGDLVVTRIRAKGRFAEDMGPIPATGGDMDVTATSVYRVHDGLITEHWGEVDSFSLMQQLGVVSMPDTQGEA